MCLPRTYITVPPQVLHGCCLPGLAEAHDAPGTHFLQEPLLHHKCLIRRGKHIKVHFGDCTRAAGQAPHRAAHTIALVCLQHTGKSSASLALDLFSSIQAGWKPCKYKRHQQLKIPPCSESLLWYNESHVPCDRRPDTLPCIQPYLRCHVDRSVGMQWTCMTITLPQAHAKARATSARKSASARTGNPVGSRREGAQKQAQKHAADSLLLQGKQPAPTKNERCLTTAHACIHALTR